MTTISLLRPGDSSTETNRGGFNVSLSIKKDK